MNGLLYWIKKRICPQPEPAPVKDCLHDWKHILQMERGCNRCAYTLSCLPAREQRD
jgi:hypothetical protein